MTRLPDLGHPWGQVIGMEYQTEGVYLTATRTHVGFYLTPERNKEIPDSVKANTKNGSGFVGFYEADGDIAMMLKVLCI